MRTCGMSRVGWVLLLAAAAPAWADTKVDETVSCDAAGTVRISNVSGTIDVVAWDRSEVRVAGTLDDKVERLRLEPEDGDVEIEVVLPRRIHGSGGDADLEVHVPRAARVEVETVSASVTAKGTKGELELESVSGSIDLDCDGGKAELETVSGAIRVDGPLERVDAQSVSGRIDLNDAVGEAEASTTSGNIDVTGGAFKYVACTSVSGQVRFEGNPARRAEIELESFSGSILVLLPIDLDADLVVETFSGSIDSEFGGRVRREEFGPGSSLEETYGEGSAELSISTFSGPIELKKMRK